MSLIIEVMTKKGAIVDCELINSWVTEDGREVQAKVMLADQVLSARMIARNPYGSLLILDSDYEPPVKTE